MANHESREPLAVSIPDAYRMIGIGLTKFYALLGAGEIPSFLYGSRRLIPVAGLRKWVERHTAETPRRPGPRR